MKKFIFCLFAGVLLYAPCTWGGSSQHTLYGTPGKPLFQPVPDEAAEKMKQIREENNEKIRSEIEEVVEKMPTEMTCEGDECHKVQDRINGEDIETSVTDGGSLSKKIDIEQK